MYVHKCVCVSFYMYLCVCVECVAPLLLEVQNKLNFTHILAGASAIGKVRIMPNHYTSHQAPVQ